MAKFSGRVADAESVDVVQSDAAQVLAASANGSVGTLSLGSAGVAPLSAGSATSPAGVPVASVPADSGGAIPTSLTIAQAHTPTPVEVSGPPVEALSFSDAFAAFGAALKSGPLSVVDTQLAALYYNHSAEAGLMSAFTSTVQQLPNAVVNNGDYVLIDATAKGGDGATLLTELQSLGLQGGSSYSSVASGYLPTSAIGDLASLTHLSFARESAFTTNAGIVTTQADHAQHNDAARDTYGVNGSGLRIGVLSDSFDVEHSTDSAAQNIASGDLPVDTRVLYESSGEDEGRGMAQLIHDLAPGASIDFATANGGQAAFANHIIALAAAGDKVIVDDVAYFAEPAYQDGIIAQAINQVTRQNGVTYFSSAGNNGQEGYQGAWQAGATQTLNNQSYTLMNFAPGQDYLKVTLGSSEVFVLQWDQPAASAGGVGSASDLDFFLTNQAGTTLYSGAISNNIGGDAVEVFAPSQTSGTYYLRVGLKSGPAPTNIRVLALGNGTAVNLDSPASNQNEGTIYGHAAAAETIGVGAVSYARTPVNDYVPPVAESFTSRGTTSIYFDDAGNRLATPIVRAGADITAVDGGNTTFFVSDDSTDTDSFPNFYGTSAAAPDAAATAILMLSANPNLTSADIQHLLMDSAIDMDDSATTTFDTGFDVRTGAGFIQADAAVGFAKGGVISASALGGQTTLYGTHLNDTIQGGALADTIFAGAGDDVVSGGAGNDVINGEDGNDTLVGGAGNDTITGGLGSDIVEGGAGNDTLYAGGGFDTVVYANAPSAVTVNLSTQSATGGDGTDLVRGFYNVVGSAFNDSITGDLNDNNLKGGAGNDTIDGGAGDDVIDGGAGDDTLNGGAGTDTVTYASATSGITYDLSLQTAQNTGGSGTDKLTGFEVIIGSAFGDTFTAQGVGERIDGAGGNDILIGAAPTKETVNQANIVKPSATANISAATAVSVAPGSFDLVNDPEVSSATIIPHATILATAAGGGGEFYSFTVTAGTRGLFDIDHGSFDSVISIFNSNGQRIADNDDSGGDPGSTVATDSFIDYTFATAGTYYVAVYSYDGPSTDGLHGSLTAGQTYTLNVSLSDEAVSYTGNLLPGGGATFIGGDGNDAIFSGSGNDIIDGGAGIDTLNYSLAISAVTVNLGLTTAQATGGGGTDTITNVESVLGSSFNDTLIGSGGVNVIAGLGGADTLTGGDGSDVFTIYALSDSSNVSSSGYDTITDFTHGSDKIDLSGVAGQTVELDHDASGHTNVFFGFVNGAPQGVLVATGDVEADDIIAPAGTQFILHGGNTADKLIGGDSFDVLIGNAGADLLIGGGGADALAGGAGADIFRYLSTNDTTALAYDTIYDFTHASDSIDLRYVAGGFVNLVHDNAGNTNVYFNPQPGNVAGDVIVVVGDVEGNDLNLFGGTTIYINGSANADTLIGGAGNDFLVGAGGVDSLTGGAGADTFLYTQVSDSTPTARDTVQDFLHLTDKIDLSAVDGGAITITHDGAGGSVLTYAFSGGTAQGSVFVKGDVEAADLITSSGAVVSTVGAFAGPDQAGAGHADFAPQHFGHYAGSVHSDLF